jgi:hypothetical protein
MPNTRFVGPLVRPFLWQKIFLSNAQVLALFTTPVLITNPEAGYVPIPIQVFYNKEAGTAYTIAGVTGIDIGWSTGGGQLMRVAPAGFLDSVLQRTIFGFGPSAGGSAFYSDLGAVNAHAGASLRVFAAGANPGTGTGGVYVTVLYCLIPLIWGYD